MAVVARLQRPRRRTARRPWSDVRRTGRPVVVLLAASIYLLKQDVVRVALGSPKMATERAAEF